MIELTDTLTRKTIKDMLNSYFKARGKMFYIIRTILWIYTLILILDEFGKLSRIFTFQNIFALIIFIFIFWFSISGYKFFAYLFFHGGIYFKMGKNASLIVRYTINNKGITRNIPHINKQNFFSWEHIQKVKSDEVQYYFVLKPFPRYLIIRKKCFTETAIATLEELIKKSFNNTSFY